ncbi:hypothetical protein PTSG_00358 [Salpingoeca rosetta]|uniref:Glutathione S-transferase n=1 Tax=Salpingoeca rosetta (strain ATCC 50818 / BSB-021) TaxID=946362 RepID=F2TW91_SALR5|nr:uncharacterized protein PTSG_00358 [Salpingoeca rosetta]EGD72337.1 hypothetical protein PTSG_00358 [Salpingoeca rosetta]|eukprot:XP_004998907.1 hypothetical protein PTSG_00358 [Salpingoeca rosetta]
MSQIKLTYFDFGVRADAVRICLTMAGVDFEDERVAFPKLAELKEAGVLPLGQLPVLEIDGVKFTQYNAMSRYAATLAGIYPEDPVQRLKMEEMIEVCTELLYKVPFAAKDEEEKKALREQFASTKMATWFAFLDKRIGENTGDWAVGETFTLADLSIMILCDFLKSGFIDYINVNFHEDYPNVKALYESVKAYEPVAKYYASQQKK